MLSGRIKQKQHFKMFNQLHGAQTLLTSCFLGYATNSRHFVEPEDEFKKSSPAVPVLCQTNSVHNLLSRSIKHYPTTHAQAFHTVSSLRSSPSKSSIRHSRNWVSLFMCCSTQVPGLSESRRYVAACRWVENKCRTFCHEDGGSRSLQLQRQLRPASGALSSQVAIVPGLLEPEGSKWPLYLDCLNLKDLQSFGTPDSACPTTRHHAFRSSQKWPVVNVYDVTQLKRILGNRLGQLHATGCEGLTCWVGLNMFGKLGTGSKERTSGNIPL